MVKSLLFLSGVFLSVESLAFDCNFVSGDSLCGVSINDTQSKYVDKLGKPDGIIEMGTGRQGLLYGQRILLIFKDQRLWEIHAWSYNSNYEFWGYVRNKESRYDMRLVIDGESLWENTRKSAQTKLKKFKTVDGDQFSEVRELPNGSIFVLYQPTFEVDTNPNDWNTYQTSHIKISLH
jgi:hypothetical protein